MKKGLFLSLALISILFLAACSKGNPLVGKWAHGSFIYTFNADGTCVYDAVGTKMECTYKTEGEKISIFYKGTDVPFETTYRIEGKTLIVKDSLGSDTKYEKK